nr:Chain A, Microtubule-associated protein tau [Homo sapiens]
AGTYGLGD